VDADPNTNLNEVLGVNTEFAVSEVQHELKKAGIYSPYAGISKDIYTELRLNQSLTETKDYDLLVIGRSEGKGCYCNVNGILEKQLEKIHAYYPYIVIDNEAGVEHISRGIVPDMDILLLVSDCSTRGIQAAGRIARLVHELEIAPKMMGLVVNRAPDGVLNDGTMEEIKRQNLNLIDVVSKDNLVYEYDCAGKPLVQIPESSPVKQAINRIVEKLDL
jgi:CO dehydrogenase maturation factor